MIENIKVEFDRTSDGFGMKETFMKKILVTGGTTFVSKYVA